MAYWQQLLIVCSLVFFAGFMDSIAGGGGIISLPAYLAAGIPPHMALGSNKFSSVIGLTVSSSRFLKSRKVHVKAALIAAVGALGGSAIGARLALFLDERYLQYILIGSLPLLAVFILRNKRVGDQTVPKDHSGTKTLVLSGLAGLIIGCYDGFFGPGAGTFLIIVFNAVIGFDLLTSSGNAKIVNFASNLAAVITFLSTGNVMFSLSIPAAAFSITGNYLGTKLALKNGAKLIKPMFIVVLSLLLIKIIYDVFI